MKTKIISILFIITLSSSLFSCITTPSGEEISFGYTPEEKYKIGRNVGANILGTYKLYYNETLYTYLNSICNSIIINSDKVNPYKGYFIGILDTQEINAFSTPGGHIFISRGMLRTTKTEDELAAIIAHELSHIQLEHSIKALKKNTTTQTIGTIATYTYAFLKELQGKKTQQEINKIIENGKSLTNFTAELINTGYSKNTEFKSDKNALILMQNTGYNPNAMISMLTELRNNKSKNYRLGFGKTHPSPKKRIKKANKSIKQIKQLKNNYNYNEVSRKSRFEDVIKYF